MLVSKATILVTFFFYDYNSKNKIYPANHLGTMIHDNKRRQMRRFLARLDTQGSRLKNKRNFARPYSRRRGGSAADSETKGAIIVVGPRGRGVEGYRTRA